MKPQPRLAVAICLVLLLVLAALAAPVCSSAADRQRVLDGMVIRTAQGYVLAADDGDYLLKGRDLSKLAGRLLEVTGVVEEVGSIRIIHVKEFQELQE